MNKNFEELDELLFQCNSKTDKTPEYEDSVYVEVWNASKSIEDFGEEFGHSKIPPHFVSFSEDLTQWAVDNCKGSTEAKRTFKTLPPFEFVDHAPKTKSKKNGYVIHHTNTKENLVQKYVFDSSEDASKWKEGTKKLCTMFKQLEVLLVNHEMGNRLLSSKVLLLFCQEFNGEIIKFMDTPGHHMCYDVLTALTENVMWMQQLSGDIPGLPCDDLIALMENVEWMQHLSD
jgi:hypothetical protein